MGENLSNAALAQCRFQGAKMRKVMFGLSLFAAATLFADYTVQMRMSGEGHSMLQRFKYKDAQHAKLENFMNGQKVSETLGVGQKTYMITYHNGEVVRVSDMDEMKKMMAAYGGMTGADEAESTPFPKAEVTWRNTGRRKKVGSLEGEVWVASYVDDSGKKETMEFVLSKQKRHRDAMRAYTEFANRLVMSGEESGFEDFNTLRPGYTVLQMEDAFFVELIREGNIDAQEFVLPKRGAGGGTEPSSAVRSGTPEPGKAQQPSEEEDEGAKTRDSINQGVDDAVEAFKSLF